jgi:hypothetical protein
MGKKIQITIAAIAAATVGVASPVAATALADRPVTIEASGVEGGGGTGP